MLGGEAGDLGVSARGQYHPATVHWALPDRSPGDAVGWIRLVHHGPTSAVASPGRLDIECRPHARRGAAAPELWVYLPGPSVDYVLGATWSLPGLDAEVSAKPESVEQRADGVTVVRFPVGTPRLTLEMR
jgi:hypothetical protein